MGDSPIVTLRGQRSDDWETLYAAFTQPSVVYYSDDLPYMSEDAFRDRYSTTSSGLHRLIGEIVLPSGRNRLVGVTRLQVGAGRQRHIGQLDVVIHPDYHNTAAAESFLTQVIAFGERWLALRRIQVIAYEDDAQGVALLGRHNFECEATLRRYGFRDGMYRDACVMARLIPDRVTSPDDAAEDTDEACDGREPLAEDDITVRGIEAADWEDVAEILGCENVYFNTLQLPYLSRDSVRDRLENIPEDTHMLAAEVDERVVGMLGLHFDFERRPHAVDLGMMVHDDYQGCGVGSHLMAAAVELCERWRNISRISLEVYTDNTAGIALYRKFGFEHEGTLRDYAYRDGRFVDAHVMARIREDQG